METLLRAALPALLTAPILAVALATSQQRRLAPAVLFLGLLVADSLLTSAPVVYGVALVGDQWNWTGKLLSLAWALAFVAFSSLSPRETGLTLRQQPGSATWAALVTLALVGANVVIGVVFGSGSPLQAETVLYQLTMPGLAEELVFRGVFLALLHRAFSAAPGRAAFRWPAAITTLAFGLVHSPTLTDGHVAFEPPAFLYACAVGVVLVWLRERTGSLVWPVLAHNATNVTVFVAGSLWPWR